MVDDNALHPEVQRYLGRGQPVLGLKVKSALFIFLPIYCYYLSHFTSTNPWPQVNFNRGFEAMFQELSQQITKNLVTSEYAKVGFGFFHVAW